MKLVVISVPPKFKGSKSSLKHDVDTYFRYDNCFANSTTVAADYTGAVSTSPTRFDVMASALAETSRDTVYQVCQWGVGTDIGTWYAITTLCRGSVLMSFS